MASHLTSGASKIKEWRENPLQFVEECIGAKPTKQQREALKMLPHNKRTSIRSGHGTGKDAFASWMILWFLSTRVYAKIPCTAPTKHQLRDVLWAEIHKWLRQSLIRDEFVWNSERIFQRDCKQEWFAVALAANAKASAEEQAETLAGQHADSLLFVIDEASGVTDPVYLPVEGALTKPDNHVLVIGNMTRRQGYFYDSHFDPASSKRWTLFQWSSKDSENVAEDYISYMAEKYGEGSNVYKIRVLGEPPKDSEEFDIVVPLHWAESCIGNDIGDVSFEPKYLGVDVARFGDDQSVVLVRQGLKVIDYHTRSGMNTIDLGGFINQVFTEEDAQGIAVDEVGVGAGVTDWLYKHHQGTNQVFGVDVSTDAIEKKKFYRLRDELWWQVREKCMKSLYSFPGGDKGKELANELASPTYKIDKKIKVEAKSEMKKRGIKSPDIAESLLMSEYFHNIAFRVWPKKKSASYDPYYRRQTSDLVPAGAAWQVI